MANNSTIAPLLPDMSSSRKRAREATDSPDVIERLLLPAPPEKSSEESDSCESLGRDAIVLPWWLKDYSLDRLRTFLEYRDNQGRAALAKVPSSADWGKGLYADTLCVEGRPLQLWVVGVLQTISYLACQTSEDTGCGVVVRLLRDVDRDALARLFAKSHPAPRHPEVAFHASHLTKGIHSIKLFSDIYDATTAYRADTAMARLSSLQLVVGDIVLVEAAVHRYNVAPVLGHRWASWKVEFDLLSMSRLVERVTVKEERVSNNFPLVL